MSENRTRRLAAIMFADMVGYTALMQEDEELARARRDRVREVLSSAVTRHYGEVLQHYGDGTLSVFASAVEAVECAVEIQLELQQAPEVPLRIGVHTGDIVRDGDGVFGDGVNIAARIEALSASGGILISEKVFDEIKNHPSVSSALIGDVQLKNVKYPVRVFAIANPGLEVPSEEDLRKRARESGSGWIPPPGEHGTPEAPGAAAPAGIGETLIQRIRDRAMVQWALVYLAGAWAVLQVVAFVAARLGLPRPVLQGLALVAFVGFFVAMVVTWFHGEKGRQRVQGREVLIIALILLMPGAALTMLPAGARREMAEALPGLPPPVITDGRPSVAILPFVNLSTEAENAYFALGLHDEVMTQLLRVSGLRVISRTSVMEYAGDRPNVRKIARELGVTYVTEATVQRIGGRLRVNVQLIDARTDDHVWAEGYDRELSDAFAVQSEIARMIADALSTTLTAEERGAISRAPTDNPEAYRFYLQGRDYYLRPGYRQEDFVAAQGLFERAIALDPDFALARAALARVHGLMYWENFDASPARLEAQRAEAEEALRLQPNLPQAHVAAGWVHYVEGDFEEALRDYEAALEGLPNDAEIVARVGYTHRRLGHWPQVFEAYEKAIQLNPRNATLFYDLGGHSFAANRRYAEAVAAYDRALALAPDLYDAALRKGLIFVHWRGQLDTLRAVVDHLPADLHLPEVDLARVDLALWERDPDGLLRLLDTTPEPVFETQLVYLPKAIYAGWAHQIGGDGAAARAAFESARVRLEPLLGPRPDDQRIRAALGYAYAGLGMQDAAAEMVDGMTRSRWQGGDALSRFQTAKVFAEILAQANLPDAANRNLEILLAGASPVSVRTLRLNPLLDPLRDQPGFQAILYRFGGGTGE
ncbi:MAG: adenylate/guanylate cyclase domain-containing protein [Gemmatimonadota bacterium]|jgi:serine/threonine-protein kinase